jgi:hypothetical protein
MWSVGVILTFFDDLKYSSPCLHLLAMFYIGQDWTQLVFPEAAKFVVFVPQLSQHIVYQP